MALTYDELYGIQNQYNKKVTEATKKTTKLRTILHRTRWFHEM